MSGKPRKKLVGSQTPTLVVPDGLEPTAVAQLVAGIARHRVDYGKGPSWSQAATVLGVERREAGRLLLELRRRKFLEFDRRPGSLRLSDNPGASAWTIRVLKGQAA